VAQGEDEVANAITPGHAGMEHRQGSRRRIIASVRIHSRDTKAAGGIVDNISLDGMFVSSAFVPEVCTCVDIEVALSRGLNSVLRIPGLVVHCCESGFGVIFRQLDTAAREFVEHCLR